MGYPNCINVNDALYFDLFDEVPYKWLKEVFAEDTDKDDYDFEVEITDVKPSDLSFKTCSTMFEFELRMLYDESFGEKYYHRKTFTKVIEYGASSPLGLKLMYMNNYEEDDENEEEEEEEDDIDENQNCYVCGAIGTVRHYGEYCKECYEKIEEEDEDNIDDKIKVK